MTPRLTKCESREEAQRLGAKFYAAGKPCRSGHVSDRYTATGTCVECERVRGAPRSPTEEELEKSVRTCVYVVQAGEYVKVGIAEDVGARFTVIKSNCPLPSRLAFVTDPLPRPIARKIEGWCGYLLSEHAVQGEWFRCSADTAIQALQSCPSDEAEPQLRLVS